MNQAERREFLIQALIEEREGTGGAKGARSRTSIPIPHSANDQRALLRALMNVRPPMPLSAEVLAVQDDYLQEEARTHGIIHTRDIMNATAQGTVPTRTADISLWQGDITRLAADAIVNAANDQMLGCFVPCHDCIDNAIHSAAGMQLRLACAEIMHAQGHAEPTGRAKITSGFNLPAQHVIHTVGPIVAHGAPTIHDRALLASCYRSCLDLAAEHHLKSIAFCCISTGEFGYPADEAAHIAVETVRAWLASHTEPQRPRVIFDVFSDRDRELYQGLLN